MDIFGGTNLRFFIENLLFLIGSTVFFVATHWGWKDAKPYELPAFPSWFKIWFLVLQLAGIVLPLIVLAEWGIGQGYGIVVSIVLSYLLMLGLQILAESWSARRFHSLVFVMVPYLYIPYRVWQLYEGLTLLPPNDDLLWVRYFLVFEIVLWILNYGLDLAQLPRLHHWQMKEPTAEPVPMAEKVKI